MKHLSKLVWLALALVVAMGSPAAAQDKPGFFAGYQFINNSTASTSVPAGWVAGVSFPIGYPMLSVVAVVDGGYKSETVAGTDISTKTHSVLGGVEYRLKAVNKMTPAVHFAGGVAHGSASFSPSNPATPDVSSNDGVIDFGGGVSYPMSDKMSLFFDIGYRRIMSTVGQNLFRLSIGVGFPIGG